MCYIETTVHLLVDLTRGGYKGGYTGGYKGGYTGRYKGGYTGGYKGGYTHRGQRAWGKAVTVHLLVDLTRGYKGLHRQRTRSLEEGRGIRAL